MGWTGDTTALYGITNITKKFLDEYFQTFHTWNPQTHTVLATSYRNGVYYEAVHELTTNEVFATITLIRRNGTELLYKDMTEHMLPGEAHPTKTILNLLTPTDNENCLEWRKRARQNLNHTTANIGDTVRLCGTVKYQDGYESDTFTIGRYGKGNYHFIGQNGKHYRAPRKWRQAVVEINSQPTITVRGALVNA